MGNIALEPFFFQSEPKCILNRDTVTALYQASDVEQKLNPQVVLYSSRRIIGLDKFIDKPLPSLKIQDSFVYDATMGILLHNLLPKDES